MRIRAQGDEGESRYAQKQRLKLGGGVVAPSPSSMRHE